jgi:hypothetical protein
MTRIAIGFVAIILTGCASVSTIPLSTNAFQITTKAMSGCSAEQTQKVAFKRAAAETIKKGYDRFVVTDSQFRPLVYSGYGIYGGTSQISNQALSVTMFKDGDPEGSKAIAAREVLGAKWQDALKEETFSCWDT